MEDNRYLIRDLMNDLAQEIEKSVERDLIQYLREKVLTITFTKKDGTERVMKCTLMDSYLPETDVITESRERPTGLVSVWDVEANGWRSFYVESITDIKE